MATLSLVLLGNSFHANHSSSQMEVMDRERCGLPVFRQYGIPVTAFFQGIDLLMKPWLVEETRQSSCIEWGWAPFSHTLLSIMGGQIVLEKEMGFGGSVPVSFFGEFSLPKGGHIPLPFTLALAGNSVLYSACAEYWSPRLGDMEVNQFPPTHSIRFEGKTGILLREECFGDFLRAFFLFQRYPVSGSHPDGLDCLENLIDVLRAIDNMPEDEVIVCPLDMEAPWIGSFWGSKIWERFFAEVSRRKLAHVFTPLSQHLSRFEVEAEKTSRPSRDLTKWMSLECQLQHRDFLQEIKLRTDREKMIWMLASGSDIFAAWGLKLRKVKLIGSAVEQDGVTKALPLGYNQSVIDVQLAAKHALVQRTTLVSQLSRLESSDYFVGLAFKMATKVGL